jgi:uncharacterized membrane protein YuzA (DUF378 family)
MLVSNTCAEYFWLKRIKGRPANVINNLNNHMKSLHTVSFILLVIGGLNWLLLGLFGWEIGVLFGGQAMLISRIIYVLVGLSAINEVIIHKGICKECGN